MHALVQHFNGKNLSNANVEPDILGRAYEYLIKMFADDAGAKAGEFFTPPEVVDILIRCLEPKPGDTIYDPTCGAGGMLVHSADFLKERGHKVNLIQCFGQEMNWQTYAIAKINMILHERLGLTETGAYELFTVIRQYAAAKDEALCVRATRFMMSQLLKGSHLATGWWETRGGQNRVSVTLQVASWEPDFEPLNLCPVEETAPPFLAAAVEELGRAFGNEG